MTSSPAGSTPPLPPPAKRASGESHLSREEQRERRKRRRERKRPQDEVEMLEFARELTWMARKYLRFAPNLLSLRQRVYMQLRSPAKKEAVVMELFRDRTTVLDLAEVMEETDLDQVSASVVMAKLEQQNKLQAITRDGRRPRVTKAGRYTDHVYYRRSRASEPARTPPTLNL